MYRSIPLFLSASLAVCLLISACQFSTVKVEETALCKSFDEKGFPAGKTSTFSVKDASIHCGVKLVHVPAETPVRAIWYSIDPASKERKELVQSDFKVTEDRWVNFFITPPPQGFTAGGYAVDIYLNDKLDNSQTFTIAGPTPSPVVEKILVAGADSPGGELAEMYSFPQNIDVVHAQVSIKDAPQDTKFTADWYQHDADNKPVKIVSTDFTTGGTDLIDFTLTPTSPLPPGRYSVDISVNGAMSHTSMFEVK